MSAVERLQRNPRLRRQLAIFLLGEKPRDQAWRRWPWRANELDEIWTGSLPIDGPIYDAALGTMVRYARRSTPAERIARKVKALERAFFADARRAFRYIDPDRPLGVQPGEVFRVEVVPGSVAPRT